MEGLPREDLKNENWGEKDVPDRGNSMCEVEIEKALIRNLKKLSKAQALQAFRLSPKRR